MRKNVIYVIPWENGWYMDFLYRDERYSTFLFSTKYNHIIFNYFQDGKSIKQLKNHKGWKKNPLLMNIVSKKIPYAMRQLKKEDIFNG